MVSGPGLIYIYVCMYVAMYVTCFYTYMNLYRHLNNYQYPLGSLCNNVHPNAFLVIKAPIICTRFPRSRLLTPENHSE